MYGSGHRAVLGVRIEDSKAVFKGDIHIYIYNKTREPDQHKSATQSLALAGGFGSSSAAASTWRCFKTSFAMATLLGFGV